MSCVDRCNHDDGSQKGWEETSKAFRKLLDKRIEKLSLKLEVASNDVLFQDLMGLGQTLQIAFDLEQSSKVFDSTINHSKRKMEREAKKADKEDKEEDSKGGMGFVPSSLPNGGFTHTVEEDPWFDDDEEDDDFFDDDEDEEDDDYEW
jgi:hypothetical protein